MRLLLAGVALAVALLLPGASAGADVGTFVRTLYIVNESTAVTDAALADALPAFQASVSLDLKRYWNVDAHLVAAPAPKGAWAVTLTDWSDEPLALGYHDARGRSHLPYARVFVQASVEADIPWEVVLTHEVQELLVDPFVDHAVLDGHTFRLVEVSDPVEHPRYAYTRPGASGAPVPISDFVTRRWYWDGTGWTQAFNDGARRRPAHRTLYAAP